MSTEEAIKHYEQMLISPTWYAREETRERVQLVVDVLHRSIPAKMVHIEDDDRNGDYCGNCGAYYNWTNYCPNCGRPIER